MLAHDLVNFLVRDVATHLAHGVLDVFLSDHVVSVDVELPEDGFELLVSEELLHADRRSEELCVVDQLVPIVVQLRDDLLQFLRANLVVVVVKGLFKLSDLNETGVVGVDALEKRSEVLDISGAQHLH